MRILFATHYYLPHVGGGTWYAYHVSRRLARRGHSLTLLAPDLQYSQAAPDVQDVPEPGLTVSRLNRAPLPLWWAPLTGLLLLLPRVIRQARDADVILAQFHPHHSIGLGAVLLGRLVRRPVALRVEDWHRWMFAGPPGPRVRVEFGLVGAMNALNEWAARHAALLLVVNESARAVHSGGRPDGPKVVVSPNAVDLEKLCGLPDRSTLRRRLRLPEGASVVVMVGRFARTEYGVGLLLEAWERVRRARPDVVLALIGDALPEDLQSLHWEALESGSVRVVPPVSQDVAYAYVSAADVAMGPLGPTLTTPLKVIEALAAGTPVILGEGSVGSELNAFAAHLRTVGPNSEALVRALLTVISDKRKPAGKLDPALEAFGWDAVAASVDTEIRSLVAGRSAPSGGRGR